MNYLDIVRGQPDNLAWSGAAVRAALASGVLPGPAASGPVVFTGMGASLAAAAAAAHVLDRAGTSALARTAGGLPGSGTLAAASVVVAASNTGRSPETVAVLEEAGHSRILVSNDPKSPAAALADLVVLLGSGEPDPVAALSYTATVQALGLVAEALGAPAAPWDRLPDLARRVLAEADESATRVAERWSSVTMVDVVGPGGGDATPREAALLLREAARLPASAYDTYEYLHGPVESAEPGIGCVVIGAGREVALARALAEAGAEVLLLTTAAVPDTGGLTVVALPTAPEPASTVLEILPVQLVAARLAAERDIPVGTFRRPQQDTKVGAR
ncbi:MAG: SIS domain-containing protein [Streptosporangiales bacterium]